MKTAMSAPAGPVFQINLVARRAQRLHRRRKTLFWSFVVAVGLLLIVAALLISVLHNLTTAFNTRTLINKLQSDIDEKIIRCNELDAERKRVAEELERMSAFVPMARARVAWAPKLAALAQALPTGMAIGKASATNEKLFVEPPKAEPAKSGADGKKARVVRRVKKVVPPPSLVFSVVYAPSVGSTQDPMGLLLERLRDSDLFMEKMVDARVEGTELTGWDGVPVIMFKGLLEGAEVAE